MGWSSCLRAQKSSNIAQDKWSGVLVNLLLFSVLMLSVYEKLYSGEHDNVMYIFMGLMILSILGRWVFLALKLRKSDPVDYKNIKLPDIYIISFTTLFILLTYINGLQSTDLWITAGLILILAIGFIVSIFRPANGR